MAQLLMVIFKSGFGFLNAQNLFNPNSPYGNWAIDNKLAILAEKSLGDIIVVAVDHAGSERVNEFLPIKNSQLGVSEGKKL